MSIERAIKRNGLTVGAENLDGEIAEAQKGVQVTLFPGTEQPYIWSRALYPELHLETREDEMGKTVAITVAQARTLGSVVLIDYLYSPETGWHIGRNERTFTGDQINRERIEVQRANETILFRWRPNPSIEAPSQAA